MTVDRDGPRFARPPPLPFSRPSSTIVEHHDEHRLQTVRDSLHNRAKSRDSGPLQITTAKIDGNAKIAQFMEAIAPYFGPYAHV